MHIIVQPDPVSRACPVVSFSHGEGITGIEERRTRKMILVLVCLALALPAVALVAVIAFVILALFGAAFSGVAVLLFAGATAGKGILLGIILGLIAYRAFRKARTTES